MRRLTELLKFGSQPVSIGGACATGLKDRMQGRTTLGCASS